MLADDGMWKGKRVLPAGWVATATGAPAVSAPERGSERVGLGWFLLPADLGFLHTGDSGTFLVVMPGKRMAAAGVVCEGSALYPLIRGVWHLKVRTRD
jgi:CubicO group peptidase (beta-lactamase class C family)